MSRLAFVVAAGATIALTVALALVASLFAPPSALEFVGHDGVVVGVTGLAMLMGVVVLAASTGEPATDADDPELPPRRPTTGADAERITTHIDRALERRDIGEDSMPRILEQDQQAYFRVSSRKAAREAATIALEDRYDVDLETASARLDDGTWTDDPRAAAYLGSDVGLPLRYHLEDWAFGARRQRGLEATIDEIETLAAEPEVERR